MLVLWCCYIVGTGLGFYVKHVFDLGNYVVSLFGFAAALIVPPIARRFRYRRVGNSPVKAPEKI